jgi:hypothetical protein
MVWGLHLKGCPSVMFENVCEKQSLIKQKYLHREMGLIPTWRPSVKKKKGWDLHLDGGPMVI